MCAFDNAQLGYMSRFHHTFPPSHLHARLKTAEPEPKQRQPFRVMCRPRRIRWQSPGPSSSPWPKKLAESPNKPFSKGGFSAPPASRS